MSNSMNIHNVSINIPFLSDNYLDSPTMQPIALTLSEIIPSLIDVIPLNIDISEFIDCDNKPDSIQIRFDGGEIINTDKINTLQILSQNFNNIEKISWDGPNFRKKMIFLQITNLYHMLIINMNDFKPNQHDNNYWYSYRIIEKIRLE